MKYIPLVFLLLVCYSLAAQDSMKITVHPAYNNKGRFHRKIFGRITAGNGAQRLPFR